MAVTRLALFAGPFGIRTCRLPFWTGLLTIGCTGFTKTERAWAPALRRASMSGGPGADPAASLDLPPYLKNINFCQQCGAKVQVRLPQNDSVLRPVCTGCGTVVYINPKVVIGSVAVSEDESAVLLVERTIPPVGKWTLPAGFMEMSESTLDGALREASEEANVVLDAASAELMCVFNIVSSSQVQILYLTKVIDTSRLGAGSETSDARMFKWADIPWENLAYPTVRLSLEHAMKTFLPARRERTGMQQILTLTKLADGTFVPTHLTSQK
ncbi:Nudix hydrolase 23, chloroplastic [Porphyridium purpureum]|uniref:Nudix hydrolase 23, chloroplastic n=1 Tax=Porphyridium purpureum TaxID=35688 RepID=A0A5J4YTQ2_PORPP|nr:Nudix hydrolase 23, chloroplastic [Porphyridium purpureum]|eukprot:POR5003..scf229_5